MAKQLTPKETELKKAVEEVFAEWVSSGGLTPSVPVAWVLIVDGSGFDEDGDNVETTMIAPNGSTNQILGLLENCRIRYAEELIEAIRSSFRDED